MIIKYKIIVIFCIIDEFDEKIEEEMKNEEKPPSTSDEKNTATEKFSFR